MGLLLGLLGGLAHAANYDVTFCVGVDIDYFDTGKGGEIGDYWTGGDTNKPCRGCKIKVWNNDLGSEVDAGNTYAAEGGLTPGCRAAVTLSSSYDYDVTVHSEAYVQGNTIYSKANSTANPTSTQIWNDVAPSQSTTVTADMDGYSGGTMNDQWNHLALATGLL